MRCKMTIRFEFMRDAKIPMYPDKLNPDFALFMVHKFFQPFKKCMRLSLPIETPCISNRKDLVEISFLNYFVIEPVPHLFKIMYTRHQIPKILQDRATHRGDGIRIPCH